MKTLFSNLEKYSNNIAILGATFEINYKELLNAADTIGGKTDNRSLVLITCKNSFASLAGYVGFIRAKSVPLLTSSTVDYRLLSRVVESYQPEYLYLPSEKVNYFSMYPLFSYT